MIYEQLITRSYKRDVRAALIGTGSYGISLLAQAEATPRLEIAVICDRDAQAARHACLEAGLAPEAVRVCETTAQAADALAAGLKAVVPDAALLWELPVDIVVECTGDPEAGASHAEAALTAGLHVAMVTKEADCIVGPQLHAMATERDLVYTPVDGDQHGLLVGLVLWARLLGFEVIAGGKAAESDFVIGQDGREVVADSWRRELEPSQTGALDRISSQGGLREALDRRQSVLSGAPTIKTPDFAELVIAANHTGLMPDRPELHAPVLRTVEVVDVFCLEKQGGILARAGVIDVFGCLRTEDEPGFMGGEFIVVGCPNAYVSSFLKSKGLMMNSSGTVGLIPKPLHLLGVETPVSILTAAITGLSTGAADVRPRVDMVGRCRVALAGGTEITPEALHQGDLFDPVIVPKVSRGEDAPIPLYMASGRRIGKAVEAGETLTYGDVVPPEGSRLWAIRARQEERFS